jgi:protein-S-isoprenylcysteine O-methyltransferase Ste14
VAGVLIALGGLALALRSAQLLAGRGRPQRGPRPALVIAGPYVLMRNPLYAGLVLALAGVALARRSWTLGVGVPVLAAGAHAWVVLVEERRLRARFGAAYDAYLRYVPRWIPDRRRG